MRRRYMGSSEEAIYTVYSDIDGATVYFDGVEVGNISGGGLTVTKKGSEVKDSYTVTLKGTLPSSTTSYTFSMYANPIYLYEADFLGTRSHSPDSYKTVVSYSLPSSKTCSKNGSVTANKVKKSTKTELDYTISLNRDSYSWVMACCDLTKGVTVNGIDYPLWLQWEVTDNDFWAEMDVANLYGKRLCMYDLKQNESGKTIALEWYIAEDFWA